MMDKEIMITVEIGKGMNVLVEIEELIRGMNGARNEGRHQQRDNDSQVLEPVLRGELVICLVCRSLR
jgi:hypothetical protein